ncbi:MAG: crossover junction endodeoxyribonuclease RuvC [Patescibacteria group bacterium]|nr:crossover junction endodeoxyribonuclease RuvC [Patescibacteria group bacterium]
MTDIIIGIDPGTATTGFGVVEVQDDQIFYIDHGTIQTPAKTDLHLRLDTIAKAFATLLKKHKPTRVAVEELYFFKNITSAISVAHARGVILQTATNHHVAIVSYTPLQVKQALTGYGKADKKQIQKMVKMILRMEDIPRPDDAADALAIAITCAHSKRLEEQLS